MLSLFFSSLSPLTYTLVLGGVTILFCIVYNSFLHTLARFPGPLFASYTNLWKVYQVYTGRYEYTLQNLHNKYGKIVRVGPNQLDIRDAAAAKTILASGQSFVKR